MRPGELESQPRSTAGVQGHVMYLVHVCTGGRYQQAISKVSSALTVLDTWNVLGSLWVATVVVKLSTGIFLLENFWKP